MATAKNPLATRVGILFFSCIVLLAFSHDGRVTGQSGGEGREEGGTIHSPRHVQVGEKGYIGLKLPHNTPADGSMKLQIKHGKGVASLRKTNLRQLPESSTQEGGTGVPPVGKPQYYDFVYELSAAQAGTLTFDANYEFVAPSSGGNGGGGGTGVPPATLNTITSAPVTLTLTTYTIRPVGDFVEGGPGTISLIVQPAEAQIIGADWRFYREGTGEIFAGGQAQAGEFQLSADGTRWEAQRTFNVPVGIAGSTDLFLAGALQVQGESGTPGFPSIETVFFQSKPVATLPGGGIVPLTVEIAGAEIVTATEGQPFVLSLSGTTPDFALTSVTAFLSDADGNALLTQPMQILDVGKGTYSGTRAVQIPAGAAGRKLTLLVSVVCYTTPEQYARDSVSIEVIAAAPQPVTLTVSAPYGTQLTEGVATKFRCRLAPFEILPKVQAFSYTFNIPSLQFSQPVGLDPALFAPVNGALECEFDVIIPAGTVSGAPAVGALSVAVTADGIVYGATIVDITVTPSGQVEPPRLTVITTAPVKLREACSTRLEFTISDGDPTVLLKSLDAITFGVVDPATGEEVAHFNIDPEKYTSMNGHLYYRWTSPPTPVGLASIGNGTGVGQLVPRLVVAGQVFEYAAIEVRVYPQPQITAQVDGEIVAGQEEVIPFVIAPTADLRLSEVECAVEGRVGPKPLFWRASASVIPAKAGIQIPS